ncbi:MULTISPECIES: DUF1918 domain-containing protein [Nonomuraea]|uniref:DUF1918 domain-containing protein n=1 Tax=Nonomuraea TaxID=83681 RepID=UPI001CD982E1|nr:DUF1918 domain-containing protein [Nonomuraea aurantiaca]MCA2229925.1 DUF1918 domain-containing protein [Nonomuraea aurantiaca]
MKAAVGDRLIVEATRGTSTRPEGFIMKVNHLDGSPPYLVRWLTPNARPSSSPAATHEWSKPRDDQCR